MNQSEELRQVEEIIHWAQTSPKAENFDCGFVYKMKEILDSGKRLTRAQAQAIENIAERWRTWE